MNIPPLAIVQARMGSTRLKNKMLLEVGGRTLIRRAWDASVEAFGAENVVFAIPATEDNDALFRECVSFGPAYIHENEAYLPTQVSRWEGPEQDVLGRFWHCAHRYRWHPDSVIVRITPDDFRKDPAMMKRVAAGERLPVEQGAEAFTLAMLDEARGGTLFGCSHQREHITNAIFATPPPPAPPGIWSIDTQADLDAARSRKWETFTGVRTDYNNDPLLATP